MNARDLSANETADPRSEDQNAAFRLLLARETDRHARLVSLDRRMRRTRLLRRCLPTEAGFRWLAFLPFLAALVLVFAGGMLLALSLMAGKFLFIEGLRHAARSLDQRLATLRREMGEEVRLEREQSRRFKEGSPLTAHQDRQELPVVIERR